MRWVGAPARGTVLVRLVVTVAPAACRQRQKPKMEILLTKSAQFDEIIAAEQAAAAAGETPAEEEEHGDGDVGDTAVEEDEDSK